MDLQSTAINHPQRGYPYRPPNAGRGPTSVSLPLQSSSHHSNTAKTIRFGSNGFWTAVLNPGALQQLMIDTTGVYAPKAVTFRSKIQAFEETFLELLEDFAFYLAIAAFGFGLASLFKKAYPKTNRNLSIAKIGENFKGVTHNVPKELLGTKAGVLLGAIALASGFEYLIQHTKNWATHQFFNVSNFTAVAGLEKGRLERKDGEDDAVQKAKTRIKQVSLLTAGALALALSLPMLVKHSPAAEKQLRKILKYVDFGDGDKPFNLARFPLALVVTSGVISYVDAARDKLERIETATRLAVVAPYILFGNALMGNWLASFIEKNKKVGSGADRKTIREHLKPLGLSYRTGANPWQQFKRPESFFELSTLDANADKLKQALSKSGLPKDVQSGITKWHNLLTIDLQKIPEGTPLYKAFGTKLKSLPLLCSALIAGVGINLIAYSQTQARFHKLHPHEKTPDSPFVLKQVIHPPSKEASTENIHYRKIDLRPV